MGEETLQAAPAELRQGLRRLLAGGPLRLVSVVATDDRGARNAYGLRYIFSRDRASGFCALETCVPADERGFQSLTPDIPAASLFEREICESFGFVANGHPDPRRLLLHESWPEGVFPLRRDFDPRTVSEGTVQPYRFVPVEGDGIFEIPVGPVHAGIIEPGHFRFSTAGEPIVHLETRLGYVHKGVEKLAEGKDAGWAVGLVERVSGDNGCAHSLAYCQALERMAGARIPPRAAALRVFFAEFERLHCHLADVAGVCTDVGFAFGAMQALRLRELVMRRAASLCGDRFLKGINAPGGVRCDVDASRVAELSAFLDGLRLEFLELRRLLRETDSLMDRVEGTGVLARAVAEDLAGVGPAVRASGVDIDLRRDHPYAAYAELPFSAVCRQGGDVGARLEVKLDEFENALSLMLRVLGALPEGPCGGPITLADEGAEGLGWAESPRGEVMHWVRMGAKGTIGRLKIKDPSFVNWPLLPWAVRGNIVPDFPLINKSFNLSYSGNDR